MTIAQFKYSSHLILIALLHFLCAHSFLKQLVVGHNEDGLPVDVNTTYIVQADIKDSSGRSLEQFTALCYAGMLCGNAFGFNNLGMASSVNYVFPRVIASDGIGV